MKNLLLFLASCIFCLTQAKAQDCFPNGLSLNSQQEIDDFAANNPDCTKILGRLRITGFGGAVTSLKPLSKLEKIGGDVIIEVVKELQTLEGLENIDSVGGNITLEDLSLIEEIEQFSKLREVNELYIENLPKLISFTGFENIEKAGFIEITDNQSLTSLSGFSNLDSVARFMMIHDLENLQNLNALDELEYVGVSLEFEDLPNLKDIGGFPQLSFVGAHLKFDNTGLEAVYGFENLRDIPLITFKSNPAVQSFSGFNNLRFARGITLDQTLNDNISNAFVKLDSLLNNFSFRNNNNIKDLDGFPNLRYIGFAHFTNLEKLERISGFQNLRFIQSTLSIKTRSLFLTDISGFSNLSSVDILDLAENPVLSELPFSNLGKIGSVLKIKDMDALTTLEGLRNADLSTTEIIEIEDNPSLQTCNILQLCQYAMTGGSLDVRNNATGCRSINQILNGCASELGKIRYGTFYDLNQDGIYQDDEPFLPDFRIEVPATNFELFGIEDSLATTFLGFGDYEVEHINEPNWDLTTPNFVAGTLDSLNNCDSTVFGVYPNDLISEMATVISPNRMRCNERTTVYFTAKNLGTTFADGIVWVKLDPKIDTATFSVAPDTLIDRYHWGYEFNDLPPGHTFKIFLPFTVPGPPNFLIGDSLHFQSYIDFNDANGVHLTDTFEYSQLIRCSYDPNDKLVHPAREDNLTLFDEDLIYTIRFQNTGNDTAYNVRITDPLDENLEVSTFQVLSTSHPDVLSTQIEGGSFLTFDFKNIFLPDSTTNLDASQGFISYKISPKNGLAEMTPIENTASIFFDLNPPIITNTTENIMVSSLFVNTTQVIDNQLNIIAYPNPNSGELYFKRANLQGGKIIVTDISGRILLIEKMPDSNYLKLPESAKGMLFLRIETEEGVGVLRVVRI